MIGFRFGIPYNSLFGHRGLSHSLFFAAVTSLIVVALLFRSKEWAGSCLRLFLFFFLATASHGFLDAMTNGGLGIAFFAPFSETRYFFPFRPILVSPIGVPQFFNHRAFQILYTEVIWVWIPSLVIFSIFSLFFLVRARND